MKIERSGGMQLVDRIVITAVVIAGIVTFLILLNTSKSQDQEPQNKIYAHAKLGTRCAQAMGIYDTQIEEKEKQLSDFSTKTANDMASLQQESQSYQDSLYNSANQSGGDINYEPVEDAARESRDTVRDGLSSINQTAAGIEKRMSDDIDEIREKRNKLSTCEKLTQREADIPDVTVIEYETLINEVIY